MFEMRIVQRRVFFCIVIIVCFDKVINLIAELITIINQTSVFGMVFFVSENT